jgi:mono/diheme cytochrome c family protein
MKSQFRLVLGLSAILLSITLFVTAFATAAGDGTSGQKLFESKCTQCHGKDAKGAEKMAKVLKVDLTAVDLTGADASKLTAEEMAKTVSGGKKKMPKFKGKLTDDQIKQVVAYVKSLQGGTSGSGKSAK